MDEDIEIHEPQPQSAFLTTNYDNIAVMTTGSQIKFSNKTKHIAVRYYASHKAMEDNLVKFKYFNTADNTADALIKALPRIPFVQVRTAKGITDSTQSQVRH